ncbi:hypothetical protein B0T22DRAFT_520323 [Podospora appendiculata]|uniref:Uncharacterized protein n=1 Tax=Podospora appendiculata TaxID=314037 RepID=A0AAE0X3E4_9PEZI|nr:hypothetical protein B0T22DRAFT_520323 [Podospora appendiculata]
MADTGTLQVLLPCWHRRPLGMVKLAGASKSSPAAAPLILIARYHGAALPQRECKEMERAGSNRLAPPFCCNLSRFLVVEWVGVWDERLAGRAARRQARGRAARRQARGRAGRLQLSARFHLNIQRKGKLSPAHPDDSTRYPGPHQGMIFPARHGIPIVDQTPNYQITNKGVSSLASLAYRSLNVSPDKSVAQVDRGRRGVSSIKRRGQITLGSWSIVGSASASSSEVWLVNQSQWQNKS